MGAKTVQKSLPNPSLEGLFLVTDCQLETQAVSGKPIIPQGGYEGGLGVGVGFLEGAFGLF